jgi:hypothetical protein
MTEFSPICRVERGAPFRIAREEGKRVTPRSHRRAYFARTPINKIPREIILSATVLFASLAPLASAQLPGYKSANLTVDSACSGGLFQCTDHHQNTVNYDLVEFGDDNLGGATPDSDCSSAGPNPCPPNDGTVSCTREGDPNCGHESPAEPGNKPGQDLKSQPAVEKFRGSKSPAFNRDIYYRNKLEFSLDVGWHPINIPFPLDVFVGDVYNTYPLKYTLVPIFASLRWQINNVGLPWILRGNWDMTFTGSVTAIPRGPETRYFAYLMGIRRNFVPRRGKVAPYFDVRLGVGSIDAKGPDGVKYAQGQDITFTINMGSGVRYNFNPRYALSAGMNFMHISNLDLSESNGKPNWGVRNYGINVYGPMVGIDVRLGRHPRQSAQ